MVPGPMASTAARPAEVRFRIEACRAAITCNDKRRQPALKAQPAPRSANSKRCSMTQHTLVCQEKGDMLVLPACWIFAADCATHENLHLRVTSDVLHNGHLRDALLVPEQLSQPVHRCAGTAALNICGAQHQGLQMRRYL